MQAAREFFNSKKSEKKNKFPFFSLTQAQNDYVCPCRNNAVLKYSKL